MLKHLFVGALLLAGTTGCSALANPKAMWAVSEPAPMSVIVRRAEVARGTAEEIDRLLTETKVDDASKWTAKTAIKKEDADAILAGVATEPVYAGAPGQKLRIVPAEAWRQRFADVCSDEHKYPSLLASVSKEVAAKFDDVAEGEKEIEHLKADIAKEDAAIDAKGASDADKDAHRKTKTELQDKLSKADDAFEPKKTELLKSLKDESAKAPKDVHDRLQIAVINLRRAVDDAKMANTAAILRYPMAVTGLPADIQETAKRVLADIIEEKTGSRPDTNGLKPDVKLDGTDVKLSLNGIPADKLGGISPGDIIEETTKRLEKYAERVVTLVPYAGATAAKLDFEADILDAMKDGMKISDGGGGVEIGIAVGDLKVETGVPGAKKKDGGGKPTGARTAAGLAKRGSCGGSVEVASADKSDKGDKDAKKSKDKDAVASKDKDAKKPAVKQAQNNTPAKTLPAKYTPIQTDDAAPPRSAPPPSNTKDCDVQVESGGKHVCL